LHSRYCLDIFFRGGGEQIPNPPPPPPNDTFCFHIALSVSLVDTYYIIRKGVYISGRTYSVTADADVIPASVTDATLVK